MSTNSPKVEIGQIWALGASRYQVLRIEGRWVVCKNLLTGSEDNFGTVLDGDMPNGWDDGWYVANPPLMASPASQQEPAQDKLTAFFKSVPAGHCACNIPREQCSYHRP